MYLQVPTKDAQPKLMLSFSISESYNVKAWCQNLSTLLEKYSTEATIFFAGKVAEKNPECVTFFNEAIDIGSQTFSN